MPPKIIVEDHSINSSREIEIEFNDSENEKKFDKLIESSKIKSPFKRRLSNEKLKDDKDINDQDEKRTKREDELSPTKRYRKDSSGSSSNGSSFANREVETSRDILDRRQKQIDYGKNTLGYDNYIMKVPKWGEVKEKIYWQVSKINFFFRTERTREHPKTPPKHLKYSRRAWDGLVKSWKKKLHKYDPESQKDACVEVDSDE